MHDEIVVWFETLSHADRTKAIFAIDRLERLGHAARMPHSKALGDGLFELRFALDDIASASHTATARPAPLSY